MSDAKLKVCKDPAVHTTETTLYMRIAVCVVLVSYIHVGRHHVRYMTKQVRKNYTFVIRIVNLRNRHVAVLHKTLF